MTKCQNKEHSTRRICSSPAETPNQVFNELSQRSSKSDQSKRNTDRVQR